MTTAGKLEVELSLDSSGYSVGVLNAGKMTTQLSRQFQKLSADVKRADDIVHAAGNSFRSTIITMGALRFALMDINDILLSFPRSVATVSGEFQRMQTLMEGLSKSADEMTRRLQGLRDTGAVIGIAKNAPFELKALSDAFVKFRTAEIDPVVGGMNALVDAVAKAGGSSEQLKRAGVAIQQMSGKGVISMEELRQQLGEAVPSAMRNMATGMGMSMAQLTAAISKGTVEARSALSKMFIQMEIESYGASERMMKTFPGALDRLKTEWQLFQKEVGDQGFMTAITDATGALTAFLGSSEGKALAKDIGLGLQSITVSVVELGKSLYAAGDALKYVAAGLLSLYGGAKMERFVGGVKEGIQEQQEQIQRARDVAVAKINASKDVLLKERGFLLESQRINKEAADKILKVHKDNQAALLPGVQKQLAAERAAMDQRVAMMSQVQAKQAELFQQYNAIPEKGRFQEKGRFVSIAERQQQRAAIAAQSAELERQLGLMRKEWEAGRQTVISLEERQAAVKKLTDVGMKRRDAVMQVVQMEQRALDNNKKMVEGLNASAAAAAKAGSAVKAFGLTMLTSMGYAAAFAIAGMAIVAVWDKIFGAAKRAKEEQLQAMRIKDGVSTQDDLEARQKRALDLKKKIEDTRGMKVGVSEGSKGYSEGVAAIAAQVKDLERQLAEENELIQKAKDTVVKATAEGRASDFMNALDRSIRLEGIKNSGRLAENQKLLEEQGRLSVDPEKNAARLSEIGSRLQAIGAEFAAYKAESYSRELSALKETAAKNGYDEFTVGAISSSLLERIENARAEHGRIIGATKLLSTPKTPGSGATGIEKEDPFLAFLKRQEVTLAETESKIRANSDGLFSAAELLEMARERVRTMSTGDAPVLQKLDAAKKNLIALDDGDREKAAQALFTRLQANQAEKVQSQFVQALAQIEENKGRMVEAMTLSTQPKLSSEETGVERLIASLQRVREQVDLLLKDSGKSFGTFVGELRSGAATVSTLGIAAKLQEENRQISADLISNEEERARKSTEITINALRDQMQARIDAHMKAGTFDEASLLALEKLYAETTARIGNESRKLALSLETPMQKLARDWSQSFKALETAGASWMESLVGGLVDGTLKVGDLLKKMLTDTIGIKMKEIIGNGLMGQGSDLIKWIGGVAGLQGGSGASDNAAAAAAGKRAVADNTATEAAGTLSIAMGSLRSAADAASAALWAMSGGGGGSTADLISSLFGSGFDSYGAGTYGFEYDWLSSGYSAFGSAFKNGGIMTSAGPKRLNAYRNGGVADSPQFAYFGEGDTPEAFVPLPDGRSIPVTMSGGGATAAPDVTVNVINQSGTSVTATQKGQPRFDGKQMILDVVLSAASQPGPFRDGLRQVTGAT